MKKIGSSIKYKRRKSKKSKSFINNERNIGEHGKNLFQKYLKNRNKEFN